MLLSSLTLALQYSSDATWNLTGSETGGIVGNEVFDLCFKRLYYQIKLQFPESLTVFSASVITFKEQFCSIRRLTTQNLNQIQFNATTFIKAEQFFHIIYYGASVKLFHLLKLKLMVTACLPAIYWFSIDQVKVDLVK